MEKRVLTLHRECGWRQKQSRAVFATRQRTFCAHRVHACVFAGKVQRDRCTSTTRPQVKASGRKAVASRCCFWHVPCSPSTKNQKQHVVDCVPSVTGGAQKQLVALRQALCFLWFLPEALGVTEDIGKLWATFYRSACTPQTKDHQRFAESC